MPPQTGTIDEQIRDMDVLIQRYFDGTIKPDEAKRLIKYQDAIKNYDGRFLQHIDMDRIFRFFAELEQRPLTELDESEPAVRNTATPFSTGMREDAFDLSNLDNLVRMAAMSPALPQDPARKKRKPPPRPTPTSKSKSKRKNKNFAYDPKTARTFIPPALLFLALLALYAAAVYFEWFAPEEDKPAAPKAPTTQAPEPR